MWPWEHLLLGYLLYSLYSNLRYRDSPTGRETLAAAFGSQLPDLVDKPLAWTFGVVETGYSIGHSIFVAPFVCLAAYALSRRLGNVRLGVAFTIAYLSHLVSDVFYPIVLGRGIEPRVVLWPIASPPPGLGHGGFVDQFLRYFGRYVDQLSTGSLTPYLAFQLGLALAVVVLWLADGAPVASDGYRWLVARVKRYT